MTRAQSRKEQAETREKRTRLHDHFNKSQHISDLRYALEGIDVRDTAQQYPVQPSASLLRLPGEMRNTIYEASLREPHMLFLDTLAAPAMCQVSSQSRKEAASSFIAENSFFTLVSRQTFSLEGNIDLRSSIHTYLDRATSSWLRNTIGLSNPLVRDIAFGFDYREMSNVVPWEAYPIFRLRPRTKNTKLVLSHWACRLRDNATDTGYGNSEYDPGVPTIDVFHSAIPEDRRLGYLLLRKTHDRLLDLLNQEDAIKDINTCGASMMDIIKVSQFFRRAFPPGDSPRQMVSRPRPLSRLLDLLSWTRKQVGITQRYIFQRQREQHQAVVAL